MNWLYLPGSRRWINMSLIVEVQQKGVHKAGGDETAELYTTSERHDMAGEAIPYLTIWDIDIDAVEAYFSDLGVGVRIDEIETA